MFDNASIKEEMLAIGYVRQSKFVYKAAWGSDEVEHFIYFTIESRGYFEAEYGLRSPAVEEFGVDSLIKYGHPNASLIRKFRDPRTACSMAFGFGRIDNFSRTLWPRTRAVDIPGPALAQFAASFISRHVYPIVRHVITLRDFFDFLILDREPHPWFATNVAIKAANVIAIGSELQLSREGLRELLIPHERPITAALFETKLDPKSCVDRYVDNVIADWSAVRDASKHNDCTGPGA